MIESIAPRWATLKGARIYSGLSVGTLRNYAAAGHIRTSNVIVEGNVRGRRLVDLTSLDEFIIKGVSNPPTEIAITSQLNGNGAGVNPPDASNLSIQLALGKLVGKLSTGSPSTLSPVAVVSELRRRGRVQIAFPGSLNPTEDLTVWLEAMANEYQTDSKGRLFRLTKSVTGAVCMFEIRFTAGDRSL